MSAEPEHHHIFELFDPGKYVQAFELDGRDYTVTILRVRGEVVEGDEGRKSRKPVLDVEGWDRPIVLNKTNARVLIGFYGPDYRQWPGKRFTMFPTQVKFGKEMVDAIRIRPKKPQPAAPSATQRPVKPIADRVAMFLSMLKTQDTEQAVEELWTKAAKLREEVDPDTLDSMTLEYEGRLSDVRKS